MQGSQVISVSMDADLLARFDGWIAAKGFPSRSAGVQHLMRERLDALSVTEEEGPAVATVTVVYDHHKADLLERLAHVQHDHLGEVVASTHVHLDHVRCLEVLILRGDAHEVRALGERVIATRGVERGDLVITSAAPASLSALDTHAAHGPPWHAAAHAHDARDSERRPRARPRGPGGDRAADAPPRTGTRRGKAGGKTGGKRRRS